MKSHRRDLTINVLFNAMKRDNRVLGLIAPFVLQENFGGEIEGGSNTQWQWRDAHGDFGEAGRWYAIGVGEMPRCFVKSGCKGKGRRGNELKEGDGFIHLEAIGAQVVFRVYGKVEIWEMFNAQGTFL